MSSVHSVPSGQYSRARPRRTASFSAGSWKSQKKQNGAGSAYSSPWNSIGVWFDSSIRPAANRYAAGSQSLCSRSP